MFEINLFIIKIDAMLQETLIVQVVVGYMYKVMKSGKDLSAFKDEFASIRHGDYREFLKLVGKQVSSSSIMVGNVNKPNEVSFETDIGDDDLDFIRLVKSGESLSHFDKICKKEYGEFDDNDISNIIFEKLTLFELSLRMHRDRTNPSITRITLEHVINEIQQQENLTDQETLILHDGRRFLNFVKRPQKLKTTWSEEQVKFEKAYKLLEEKRLTILS